MEVYFIFLYCLLSPGGSRVALNTWGSGAGGCLILSDLALPPLPFSFHWSASHVLPVCSSPRVLPARLLPCPFFPISLCWHWLVILFWAPPFLREKIKEELIHIIHIHNPIIGCMIHQLTLQEGHTLLAHYPLRFFCHGVTMSLHISFWCCSFLFSSSMQVSWLTFGSSALHPGGPLNFSFLDQRLSVECHHENALLGNLLWSELLQKGLLRHHSHLLLPESDEVDWA